MANGKMANGKLKIENEELLQLITHLTQAQKLLKNGYHTGTLGTKKTISKVKSVSL